MMMKERGASLFLFDFQIGNTLLNWKLFYS